ncbi:plasmid mobilization relaxosome protein MobC [Paracoccus ravus]|uniref:plasmid mobilization relaxosome protein MobC n=1 Tax=Paracoccus ravus TaxID=2447760 RepID=UPI001431D607|nr:plasmid mobilization relaxosome protein MobC [Paracoccus ravus]
MTTITQGSYLRQEGAPAPATRADVAKRKRAKTQRIRESGATTTSGKAVTVRLSPEELEALAQLQTRMGAGSRSDALRSVLRASVGLLEFPPEEAAKLGEIKSELHKIGVNVNQIALAANRGRVDLARAEWQVLNELRLTLPKLRTWLSAVVEEQRRRGVRLFRNYSERADG